MAGEDIVSTDTAQVNAVIVISFWAVNVEKRVPGEGSFLEALIGIVVEVYGNSVNTEGEYNGAFGGEVCIGGIRTDSSTRNVEDCRVFTRGFRFGKHSIKSGMAECGPRSVAYMIGIHLCGALFGDECFGAFEWEVCK